LWLPGAAHAGGTQSSNRFAPAGSQHLYSWQRERNALALDLLGRAIERDPGYGIAFAVAGWSYAQLHVNGWTEDQERDRRKGVDLTRRAWLLSELLNTITAKKKQQLISDQQDGERYRQHAHAQQLARGYLCLNDVLEPRSLEIVRLDTSLGGGPLGQGAAGTRSARDPDHAAVLADLDLDPELGGLPLGIPAGVLGEGEEHRGPPIARGVRRYSSLNVGIRSATGKVDFLGQRPGLFMLSQPLSCAREVLK
jgi:hypothetical protein